MKHVSNYCKVTLLHKSIIQMLNKKIDFGKISDILKTKEWLLLHISFQYYLNNINERDVEAMDTTKQRMINFLLENANPSIKYRVKKEIIN